MNTIPEMTNEERDAFNYPFHHTPSSVAQAGAVLVGYILRVEQYLEERRMSAASNVNPEFPLYPSLSEEGALEAQAVIDGFKKEMLESAKRALSDVYADVALYIESDSWTNFRNNIVAGLRNYGHNRIHTSYDFKAIRAAIFHDFREEIIEDLQTDILKENEELKAEIKRMYDRRF